ncbi:MAG: chemotaxis protein CheW [Chitinivibrionales bacterium]|nr:chemotaxis protein CheW [Chitinivibrionales bacterium]
MTTRHDTSAFERMKRRIDQSQKALEATWSPSAEESEAIMKKRAGELARPPEEQAAGPSIDVLVFTIGDEHYAIETRYVREVYPFSGYTPLPYTPEFVLGVIAVRSTVVSVIDIRVFFGMARRGLSDSDRALILRSEKMTYGILIDGIEGCRSIFIAQLQVSLHTEAETDVRRSYMRGVTPERLIVLDAEKMLTDRRLIVDDGYGPLE